MERERERGGKEGGRERRRGVRGVTSEGWSEREGARERDGERGMNTESWKWKEREIE